MNVIAYDLGTGGVKAALYDESLHPLAKTFIEYPTYYPQNGMHEQKPEDWWSGVVQSTRLLLEQSKADPLQIGCIALSGHSCVSIPLDRDLKPIYDAVPIWSDTRAEEQTSSFFEKVSQEDWYLATGNGFPPSCYSLFKLMWFKQHHPDDFSRIHKVAGSKDYINLRMTGSLLTDPSYASSTGAYDLKEKKMRQDFLDCAGIPATLYPEIVPSHTIVGFLSPHAAEELHLHTGVAVACGGVDNACMALGAVGAKEGAVYISLGSSSWVPVNSVEPVLDYKTRPYVFAHIQEDMFTSAYSIFAGGSSYQWARDTLCADFPKQTAYRQMDELAASLPVGSGGILFNPSLAGGTSQDKSVHIRGAFLGLHLGTDRAAMIRAVLEGITLNLRSSLELLSMKTKVEDQLLICGGGSKSAFWMQMFADVFKRRIQKTNIDQDAASLGAAAICARAMKIWNNYDQIPELHKIERICTPNPDASSAYDQIYERFMYTSGVLADLGDYLLRK